jgi:hypothetical protein
MIKLLTSVAGDDFSYEYGQEVSLDKEFEQRLVETGQAVAVVKRRKAKGAADEQQG